MSDDELEEIRRRKLLELQRKGPAEQRNVQMQQQLELQKQALLRSLLTPEARQRLANLKMIKPEFISQLELQLIQLAQQGKIPIPLTDKQLKQILIQVQARKRDIKIRRVRNGQKQTHSQKKASDESGKTEKSSSNLGDSQNSWKIQNTSQKKIMDN